MSNRERVHLGSVDEFESDEPTKVTVENQEICLIHTDGDYHALGNRCPHKGGPLHHGEVFPEVSEDREGHPPGERPELVYTDNKVIVCPWHGYEFDVDTGKHAGDPNDGVPYFDVVVKDGEVYLER